MSIRVALLTPNQWSRGGVPMEDVRGIVLHWVQNAGTSAEFNRRYFESLKDGVGIFASSHYIIDPDEVIYCVPEEEVAYHAGPTAVTLGRAREYFDGWPNGHTIGIELCHIDWEGRFADATLKQAVELTAELCKKYSLDPAHALWRHFDITGKDCPRWWVNHPEYFDKFTIDVLEAMA